MDCGCTHPDGSITLADNCGVSFYSSAKEVYVGTQKYMFVCTNSIFIHRSIKST